MNWDAIGAIGEILGAVAVGFTLVYLAIQVKQVKKDLHVSGFREINKFFVDASEAVTPELAKIIAKNNEGESLDDWEAIMLDEYFFRSMTVLEVAWEHTALETIDADRDDVISTLKFYLDKPGFEGWWCRNRQGFFWPMAGDCRPMLQ